MMGLLLSTVVVLLCVGIGHVGSQTVFVSEIHFDNVGQDTDEAVEVTGPAGTDLAGWSIALYNGNNGALYSTIDMSETIQDQIDSHGAVAFAEEGIQNGDPDGLALVDTSGEVTQFLSYSGSFTGTDGPAAGMTSTDIGVTEESTTSTGLSLQLTGSGMTYDDFTWIAGAAQSFGQINSGLCFTGDRTDDTAADGQCSTPTDTPTSSSTSTPFPTDGGEPVTETESPVAVTISTSAGELCEKDATAISSVQGSETESPLVGEDVMVAGVVTAVFPGLSGFFVQDAGDRSSRTSDGIFVYIGTDPTLLRGDYVTVHGTVTEYYNSTQISVANPVDDVEICSTGNRLPDPVPLSLPSDATTLESLEGMYVSIQSPVVTDNYNAGTYGEITVAAERLWQYTQVNRPGDVPETPTGTTIVIDDGATGTFPNPDTYVDQANVIRVGQTLESIEGIMAYGFDTYRLQPTSTLAVKRATNPRPSEVPEGGGNVRVASFNVLNYFTTLGSRGAETEQQREDQLAKITQGALALTADIMAIIEVENDYDAETPSIQAITDSINVQDADADWTYVSPSAIPLGSDETAVGIIYDANKLSLKGPSDVLDYGDDKTRASLAQTFEVKCGSDTSCPAFSLVSNHFKSKGSDCDSIDDPDTEDGQGNCNLTRTKAMTALVEWINGPDIAITRDEDILLAGDFNAYAMEDPIVTATQSGYQDLSTFDPSYPRVSSYVYDGESGTLDYILASASAVSRRVGAIVHHHVNAAETAALEYDDCGTNDACTVALDQYRCSDHDMVVHDFDFI